MKNMAKRFKDEEFLFTLTTAFKVSLIFVFLTLFALYLIWLILSINTLFIEAQTLKGFENIQSIYKDYILSNTIDYIPYLLGFIVLLFLGGIYIAKLLMRPFKEIEKYCSQRAEGNQEINYEPDFFSEHKLLTRFSEFFFAYLADIETSKTLRTSTIPPQYQKIHKPPFDRIFFFHFALMITIIAISNFIFLVTLLGKLQEGLMKLVTSVLKDNEISTSFFIGQQEFIFDSLTIALSVVLILYYFVLAFHLYGKVSGAVFGFFSTMRSFMKGNYDARVHLLGFNHIRPSGRALNKYLKTICDQYHNKKDS
tara:strand:+ start:18563 stop:19492 length:930 start_codon:yes stop_codon:yes gene_type:complete